MNDAVPMIELGDWFGGSAGDRNRIAAVVDQTLQRSGVTGHGLPVEAAARTRALARQFFALPWQVKSRYAVSPQAGRGWLGPGAEANAASEDGADRGAPPDLKESLSFGADRVTGHPDVDRIWFQPNNFPTEVAGLAEALAGQSALMHGLADRLLELCAAALGLRADHFAAATDHPTYTFNVNHYPPMTQLGRPAAGQFRIGAHTDFGTLTVLDREPGAGGLQVHTQDGVWVDAPYHPEALTINIGDLLARWTGDRWYSARHRVLPPQLAAPDEDLVSLVFFYETNHDAVIESLPAPIGRRAHPAVRAGEYLAAKYAAITV
jgi:isopenicillin N synthase-like dioxygenase